MIKIDDSLLEEIGLISLPKAERDQMLRQIYETLEMRVGMKLAERMSDQQLDEFERFIDTNDEAGALKWLETNFPDYKQVVADELDKLKGEIKQDSSKIIETMQAQGQQGQLPQQPQPYQAPAPQPVPAQQYQQPQSFPNSNTQATPQPFQSQPQPIEQPYAQQPTMNPNPQPAMQSQPAPQYQQPQQDDVQSDSAQSQQSSTPPSQSGSIPPPPSF